MNYRRNITFVNFDDLSDLMRSTDAVDPVYAALGYMTTYAHTLYDEVRIELFPQSKEITASYTNAKGSYFIAAIWDAEKHDFTFHS